MRRIITGLDAHGKSTVLYDGPPQSIYHVTSTQVGSLEMTNVPAFLDEVPARQTCVADLWATDGLPRPDAPDLAAVARQFDIEPSGTGLLVRYHVWGADLDSSTMHRYRHAGYQRHYPRPGDVTARGRAERDAGRGRCRRASRQSAWVARRAGGGGNGRHHAADGLVAAVLARNVKTPSVPVKTQRRRRLYNGCRGRVGGRDVAVQDAKAHRQSEDALAEYRAAHVPLFNRQPIKLGLFAVNASGNIFFSNVPEMPTRYRVWWEHSLGVARQADAMGLEALIPVARWRGFGGEMNWNGSVFETLTYAAAIAASTSTIMSFSTVHVPLVHPVVAAKAIATIDHISGGRAGLNIVMGWYEKEMRMMGTELRAHDDRYGYGAEWTEVVERLWRENGGFDHHGKYFNLEQCESEPKPVQPRPVLLNAGGSPAGIDFAAHYADFNFTSFVTSDQASRYSKEIRAKANDYGRRIGLVTLVVVVCRETEAEAKAAYQSIIDYGDWEAANNFMHDMNLTSTFKEHMQREFLAKFVAGSGGYALVGTPEQITDGFKILQQSGIDCVLLGMIDYVAELDYFAQSVMPLLKQAGIRI